MVQITENASKQIVKMLERNSLVGGGLRVGPEGRRLLGL